MQKNSLKNFLWLISLPGVVHVDEVRVVFALLVVGERGVVTDPIVSHLDLGVGKSIGSDEKGVKRVRIHSRK